MCQDIEVALDENGQATILASDVDGGSWDPDGDPITLTVDPQDFDCGDLGANTVTLTVSDGVEMATCEAMVTVVDNIAPVPDVTPLPTVTGQCSATILTAPTAMDNCAGIVTGTTTDPLTYNQQGICTVTWTYDDGNGNTSTQTQTVIVKDTTAPTIIVSVSPDTLWAPNHKMVEITATVDASDVCDSELSVVLTSIESNEPGNGDDIEGAEFGTEDYTFLLQAERDGNGDGRIYTITYTVTDTAGNSAIGVATVTVPHDQGEKQRERERERKK
ncbi:hypothetical protein ACFLUZ_04310 [Chloroflexota bacterium]